MLPSRSRPIYAKYTDRARSAHCSNYHLWNSVIAPFWNFYDFVILVFALSNGHECKCKTAKVHGDRCIKGAKEPGNELAWEWEGQGAKGPGSEGSKERKFQGANWSGFYWLIRSGERIGPWAKRLGTFLTTSRSKEITSFLNIDYLVKVIDELLIWQFKAIIIKYRVRVYTIQYPLGNN